MERILIVDDDPGFRKLLETILVGEGYGVESAGSVKLLKARFLILGSLNEGLKS